LSAALGARSRSPCNDLRIADLGHSSPFASSVRNKLTCQKDTLLPALNLAGRTASHEITGASDAASAPPSVDGKRVLYWRSDDRIALSDDEAKALDDIERDNPPADGGFAFCGRNGPSESNVRRGRRTLHFLGQIRR
jgi:hypothetical protein